MTEPDLFTIHEFENNPDSQRNLNENKKKFAGQCAYVLALLNNGSRLTRRSAMVDHGITSLERRVKDLKDVHKIPIQDCWVYTDGKRSHKEYYINAK